MLERFLKQTEFSSYDDFMKNFKVIVPENFNFGYDVIDGWAAEAPDKQAILWTNEAGEVKTLTYAQYKEESDRTASYLQSLGIVKGDRVMLILKRRIEWWICMVALHKLGAIAIPATHLLTDKDITYRCNAAGIKAIIACGDENVTNHINLARPNSPTLEMTLSIGPNIPEGWLDFHAGVKQAAPFKRIEHLNTNEDSMLMYFTSGTSGEPKMVVHDYTYPLGHIITGKYWHNLHDDSLHLTLADTGWGKAVWGKFYGQMIAGASVFIYDFEGKFHPADLLRIIEKFHITSFCAPPTVFRFLIREDVKKYDISSLHYCTIAGEALNPSVYEEWLRLTGIKLMEGYGQTETTLVVGTYPWCQPKPGSMGVAGPQYDVDVLDNDGKTCAAGVQGQLVIRTDKGKPLGLFKEYYLNPKLTDETHNNGVYYTGDIVSRDEDGYFWFVGRADDVIKSSGYRIGPFEVESALMTHPAVVECAITGVPDEVRGQIVKATIVLAPDYKDKAGDALVKEIQDHVKRVTAPYKYPRVIEFVNELPKTISGKIRRVEIRENEKK
jgi:acetyl-CoA synthetase